MLKLLIINMVTHITLGDKSRDEELANADEYLDITRTPKSVCMKNLRARRLIGIRTLEDSKVALSRLVFKLTQNECFN